MRAKKKTALYQVTKLNGDEIGIFRENELLDYFKVQFFQILKNWINKTRPYKALFYIKSYKKPLN